MRINTKIDGSATVQERRPNGPDEVSPRQLAVHFTMGALLGTLAALFLVFSHASLVHRLFSVSAAPPAAIVMFVAMCAVTMAIGASMTGAIFSTMEAERIAQSKRRPPKRRT
jgi:uncharacterized membrane protein